MFLKIISLAFLFYILYRFVFGFLVPVIRATQKIKQGFRNMQQQADESTSRQHTNATDASTGANEKKKEPVGDYIDFEEIKER